MKFIEPDFARAVNLLISWEDNGIDEMLSKQDFKQFEDLVFTLLCRIEYQKGSVKYDKATNKIIVKLVGKDKDELNIISYTPGTYEFRVKLVEDDIRRENEWGYRYKKFLEKMQFTVYYTRTMDGFISVEASSEEEAIQKVQNMNPDVLPFDSDEFTAENAL